MRYLGIDYGAKRIGVAISDGEGKIAFPHSVVPSDKHAVNTISNVILSENIGVVVIGESLNLTGEPNKIQKKIDKFAKLLEAKEMDFEVAFEPEFMTSQQSEVLYSRGKESRFAKQREKNLKKVNNDASAAALILQSHLDRKRGVGDII